SKEAPSGPALGADRRLEEVAAAPAALRRAPGVRRRFARNRGRVRAMVAHEERAGLRHSLPWSAEDPLVLKSVDPRYPRTFCPRMTIRNTFFRFYWRAAALIAPRLKYSQQIYEDVLREHSNGRERWLRLGCGHSVMPT